MNTYQGMMGDCQHQDTEGLSCKKVDMFKDYLTEYLKKLIV